MIAAGRYATAVSNNDAATTGTLASEEGAPSPFGGQQMRRVEEDGHVATALGRQKDQRLDEIRVRLQPEQREVDRDKGHAEQLRARKWIRVEAGATQRDQIRTQKQEQQSDRGRRRILMLHAEDRDNPNDEFDDIGVARTTHFLIYRVKD